MTSSLQAPTNSTPLLSGHARLEEVEEMRTNQHLSAGNQKVKITRDLPADVWRSIASYLPVLESFFLSKALAYASRPIHHKDMGKVIQLIKEQTHLTLSNWITRVLGHYREEGGIAVPVDEEEMGVVVPAEERGALNSSQRLYSMGERKILDVVARSVLGLSAGDVMRFFLLSSSVDCPKPLVMVREFNKHSTYSCFIPDLSERIASPSSLLKAEKLCEELKSKVFGSRRLFVTKVICSLFFAFTASFGVAGYFLNKRPNNGNQYDSTTYVPAFVANQCQSPRCEEEFFGCKNGSLSDKFAACMNASLELGREFMAMNNCSGCSSEIISLTGTGCTEGMTSLANSLCPLELPDAPFLQTELGIVLQVVALAVSFFAFMYIFLRVMPNVFFEWSVTDPVPGVSENGVEVACRKIT